MFIQSIRVLCFNLCACNRLPRGVEHRGPGYNNNDNDGDDDNVDDDYDDDTSQRNNLNGRKHG